MQLKILLNLSSEQIQRHLLTGLDRWVELGLLTDAQVREIAAVLSESLPEQTSGQISGQTITSSSKQTPAGITDFPADETKQSGPRSLLQKATAAGRDRQAPSQEDRQANSRLSHLQKGQSAAAAPVAKEPQKPSWIAQAFSSLIEEISVLWLLFLGVFLVIVSSGVLAASQWNSFSAVGQYGVLFAYTLAFWAGSLWSQQQENLQSTGRMLALTTLLLIPVNFWVMDRFEVLSSPIGMGLGAIAAIALSSCPLTLSSQLMPSRLNRLNLLGLSWLQWGWGWPIWPVAATYLGTVSTAANLTRQDQRQHADSAERTQTQQENASGLSFDVLTVALSILVLLFRSLWVAQVPPYQLGLAAGICGWLLVWLTRDKLSSALWEKAGFGLLLLGWAVTVTRQPPLQAIAISLLTLSLLWSRLCNTWQRFYLFAVVGVGVQTYGLLWSVVPITRRDRLLTWLNTWSDIGDISRVNWAGIGLFPTVLAMLALGAYLRQRQQRSALGGARGASPSLGTTTDLLALVAGLGFAVLSAGHPFTAAINLSLATLTLVAVIWQRQQFSTELVSLAHGSGLLAAGNAIYCALPDLSLANWANLALGAALVEFFLHLALQQRPLQKNTWWAGLGLAAVSYGLLVITWAEQPLWIWLLIPVMLTGVANHRRALYPRIAAIATMVTLLLQTPWLQSWPIAILSFGVAALCMGFNSRIWRHPYAACFTVGAALLLAGSLVFHLLVEPMGNSTGRMTLFWVVEIWSLWMIQRGLARRTGEVSTLYIGATRLWAAIMLGIFVTWGTLIAIASITTPLLAATPDIPFQASDRSDYIGYLLAATTLLIAALAEMIRQRPMEWRYWTLGWAVELTVIVGLWQQGITLWHIGIATLALAFIVQITADIWVAKHPGYCYSWHGIPLCYAALGLLFGHFSFQADTGLYTIATGLLLLGIGRRRQTLKAALEATLEAQRLQKGFKVLSYTGLAALSIGAYELLIYRLMQASGGSPGDGITLLAALALGLTALYRSGRRRGPRLLKISAEAFSNVTHLHWLLGSALCIAAAEAGLSQPNGIAIWTGCSLLLAGYALSVGNRRWTPNTFIASQSTSQSASQSTSQSASHEVWTSIGLIGALLCIAYDRFVWFPDQTQLLTWGGAIACLLSLILYYIPWATLGWGKPWRILALWLPLLTLTITLTFITTWGLLIVATFYAWMANQVRNVRLSYLSILLFDLALMRYLGMQGWLTTLVLSLIAGLSVLYVAEVDPHLQQNPQRQQRHWLRILASSLVGITALYQTESSNPFLLFAAIACLIGVAFIFGGLILKVRAFLYVGTATFILQILRVLWLFINDNSLILWAVGIVLGLLFIWIAATFESRRSQLSSQLSAWTTALESWD